MFLKAKHNARGKFEKLKARLVANGAQQDKTLYTDVSSPTAKMQSIMMCLTVAARERRKVATVDIGGAYLNAKMKGEDVLMELDSLLTSILAKIAPEIVPYIDKRTGKLIVKLDRALYGCVQSAKLWYLTIKGYLEELGFVANTVDPCVLNKMINGKQLTLVLYVDDLLVSTEMDDDIDWNIDQLRDRFGEVTTCRDKNLSYLGMHLKFEDQRVIVSMRHYIEALLAEYDITGVAASPATGNLFECDEDSPELNKTQREKFHRCVAQVLFLSKRPRLDVLLTDNFLCTRVKNPTVQDQEKLTRLLKYLAATIDRDLVLEGDGDLAIDADIDASFGCHSDGKGHSACVVKLGGACVLAKSSKQKIVTRDSTESKLVALSDMVTAAMECNDFMRAQGHDMASPRVNQDNTSTISLVRTGGGKYRTKYMKVRQSFVKDLIDRGDITVEYKPTKMMLADLLTKPLQGTLFRVLRDATMRYPIGGAVYKPQGCVEQNGEKREKYKKEKVALGRKGGV
jgi:hypothetical protein